VSTVHFVVPAGIDDPTRPSGGNVYDRRIARGLAAAGWEVRVLEAPGTWPRPDAQALAALAAVIGGISNGAAVLIDGLVASPAPEVLRAESRRVHFVVLVHMPLGHAGTAVGVRQREGAALSEAAAVVTTSAWSRRALLDLYSLPSERIYVAEPGVDRAALAPVRETAGDLLAVAAVTPAKGHDVLLEALVPLAGLAWRCQWVGSLERDPAFVRRLRRRVFEEGMSGRVRFSGPQARADLARSYAAADVLVLPSRAETYGMVVAEALARGVPVVATDVGGVPEALGHGLHGTRPGVLVPAGDPAALRGALRAWLEDADLRRRLRAAARERRTSLADWSTTSSAVAAVLQKAKR
jgi:glycosyltransferase involved in cell wall biosynthesis